MSSDLGLAQAALITASAKSKSAGCGGLPVCRGPVARGLADRVAATGCATLAVLEYVNYYHRQLQHFDNKADFKRMLAGKGFRQSWLARDLSELRRQR